jgi:phosphorylated adapter RNA export protein
MYFFSCRLRPETEQPKIKEKYNVWAATLQDDLMENMRGCDVTQSDKRSRDVESYDYSIKYRLNNESTFKRYV